MAERRRTVTPQDGTGEGKSKEAASKSDVGRRNAINSWARIRNACHLVQFQWSTLRSWMPRDPRCGVEKCSHNRRVFDGLTVAATHWCTLSLKNSMSPDEDADAREQDSVRSA